MTNKITYQDVTGGYAKLFYRPWTLAQIVAKMSSVTDRLQTTCKSYQRELEPTDSLLIQARGRGKELFTHDRNELTALLPRTREQKYGIVSASSSFRTTDHAINLDWTYKNTGFQDSDANKPYYWQEPGLFFVLSVSGFTEKDLEEHNALVSAFGRTKPTTRFKWMYI